VQFTYDLGVQLPLEERQLTDDSVIELTRVVGAAEVRVPLTARDWLVARFGELPGFLVSTQPFVVPTSTSRQPESARMSGTRKPPPI
jgi:hypothetical protein